MIESKYLNLRCPPDQDQTLHPASLSDDITDMVEPSQCPQVQIALIACCILMLMLMVNTRASWCLTADNRMERRRGEVGVNDNHGGEVRLGGCVCVCGGKVRWNKGQDECVRCGWSLISRFHSRETLWKHQVPFTFKLQTV